MHTFSSHLLQSPCIAVNGRSIALFASPGFEVVRTVFVFDRVEMRVADRVAQSWPVGPVREYRVSLMLVLGSIGACHVDDLDDISYPWITPYSGRCEFGYPEPG